jgi:hypothetical protein
MMSPSFGDDEDSPVPLAFKESPCFDNTHLHKAVVLEDCWRAADKSARN